MVGEACSQSSAADHKPLAPNWQLEAEGGGRDLRLRRKKPNRALRLPGLLVPHLVLKSKGCRLSTGAFLARLGFGGGGTGVKRGTMSVRKEQVETGAVDRH